MPKYLRKLSYPIMAVMLALLGMYLYKNSATLYSTLKFNSYWMCALCLFAVGRYYLNSLVNQITLAELGAKMKSGESFSLTSIASVLQMLFPLNAGAVFRAVYLKRRYRLSYAHFVSTQFGIQIIGILITSSVAVVTLSLIADIENPAILSGLILNVFAFCSALGLIWFPRLKRHNHRLWDKLAMVSEGCHAVRQNRVLMFKIFVISVAKTLCDAMVFWAGTQAVGLEINIQGAVSLTSVSAIAACLRVTPGALGTYEALIGLVSASSALTSAQAITVSLVIRTIGYLIGMVLLPVSSWWLSKRYGFNWKECDQTTEENPSSLGSFSQAA